MFTKATVSSRNYEKHKCPNSGISIDVCEYDNLQRTKDGSTVEMRESDNFGKDFQAGFRTSPHSLRIQTDWRWREL
jgi:hypothetical protein